MTPIHPLGYRVAVQESPVDMGETERPSGLIVKKDNSGLLVKKGVVIEVGEALGEDYKTFQHLESGMVVYYTVGYAIEDVTIVDGSNIVAWEK